MASTIKSNTVTNATASTLTLGESGTTVTLACGATQSGFGRTGTVDWCTTAKTSPFTAATGKGYMVNTCGGAVTVTLPTSPSAGDIVSIADYKNTWAVACKAVTVGRGGSKINAVCNDAILNTQGQSVSMVYIDGTVGWKSVQDSTSNVTGNQPYNVQYLVVAGGAGAGTNYGAGGGGGGYRTIPGKTFSVNKFTSYPIVVGGGGAGQPGGSGFGSCGSNSTFSTIASAGGGGGGHTTCAGKAGGSGGGGGGSSPAGAGGAGNTPPVSPAQGSNGGAGTGPGGGGGGGHSEAGQAAGGGGRGGAGSPSSITGSAISFSGGGGAYPGGAASPCGSGGAAGAAGATNKGGGGGTNPSGAAAGGSGKVVIRYVTACASGCASGGCASTCGSDTIRVFNADGTFVA